MATRRNEAPKPVSTGAAVYPGLALVQNNVAHLQADSVMLPHDVAMMPGPVVLITEAPR